MALLRETRDHHGWITTVLHWIGAIFVVALFVIGGQLEDFGRGASRDEMLALNVFVGCFAVFVLAARLVWRVTQPDPTPPPQPFAIHLLSRLVEWGLLAAIGLLILTGPILQWTVERPVELFGLFGIPIWLATMRDVHEVLEKVHGFSLHAIIPLLVLHVLGAVNHLVIERDGVFQRMVRVKL